MFTIYALRVSVVSWVVFLSQSTRFLKKIRGAPFAVLFSTTYTLNIFFFFWFVSFSHEAFLSVHTHTPLIVVLLRLREKLRRASNFGGEKSEWCGRALFYAALNFDHLPSFIIRAQNKRETVFYLREDVFGGQRTFLFFSFRKRNTGHCHGDIDDDAFFC